MALVPQGDTSFLRRRSASDICDAFAQCCPKCQQAGKIIKLKYYQINFQEAIYLCADEDVSSLPLLNRSILNVKQDNC